MPYRTPVKKPGLKPYHAPTLVVHGHLKGYAADHTPSYCSGLALCTKPSATGSVFSMMGDLLIERNKVKS